MKAKSLLLLGFVLATGCASYDGRNLVAGGSTEADVEATMGRPAEKIPASDGGSTWYYPHAPAGRDTYAVRIGADGKVRSVEQRLTEANFPKLVAGSSTTRETREIFGPPSRVIHNGLLQREVWEYPYYNTIQIPFLLFVQFSGDGVVREVFSLRDPNQDAGSYSN